LTGQLNQFTGFEKSGPTDNQIRNTEQLRHALKFDQALLLEYKLQALFYIVGAWTLTGQRTSGDSAIDLERNLLCSNILQGWTQTHFCPQRSLI
jgi:hypothetical protein